MDAQLTAFGPAGPSPRGPRGGRPRTKGTNVTSVQLSADERLLLEHIADTDGVGLGDVWRRALRVYADQRGIVAPTREVTA